MTAAVDLLADARNKLSQNVAFDEEGEAYFTAKKVEEQEDGMLIEKSEDSERGRGGVSQALFEDQGHQLDL